MVAAAFSLKSAPRPGTKPESTTPGETEITRTLQETAQARQFAQAVQQTFSPYEGMARAQGMDAMGLAASAMQTVAVLQMGAPQQKAQALAQVIRAYGVDVNELAAALDGREAQRRETPCATTAPAPLAPSATPASNCCAATTGGRR